MFVKCLAATALFVVLSISAVGQHRPDRSLSQRPATSSGPRIDRLILSTSRIVLPCPPGVASRSGSCNDSTLVIAKAEVSGADKDAVTYQHLVTGGRIVSRGGGIFEWDLAGVTQGEYLMSLTASDKRGRQSEPVSVVIELVSCPDCGGDSCHVLTITDPAAATPAGSLMEFSAVVTGPPKNIQYTWTVSAGTIESGQGTAAIKVRTDPSHEGMTIAATVEISSDGGFGPMCDTTATGIGAVAVRKPGNQ